MQPIGYAVHRDGPFEAKPLLHVTDQMPGKIEPLLSE